MSRGNVRVKIDTVTNSRGIKQAEKDLTHLQEHGKAQLHALAKSALSAGAAFATFEGVKTAVDSVEMLTKSTLRLNEATGLSVKEASAFAAVAESRNIDQKKLGQTFAILSKQSIAAATGTKATAAAFQALGVPLQTLKSGNFDKVFMSVADGMSHLHGGTEKTAIATKLFGRSWQDLIPLLQGGSKGIRENLALADKYGATLGVKNVKQLHEFIQKQHEAQLAMLGLNVAIGTKLAPTLTKLIGGFSKFIGQMRDGTGAGGKFADTLSKIAGAFKPIVSFFKDHPRLIAIAVAAWAAYRVAAAAALAATKLKLIGTFLGLSKPAAAAGAESGAAFGTAFSGAAAAGIAVAVAAALYEGQKAIQKITGGDLSAAPGEPTKPGQHFVQPGDQRYGKSPSWLKAHPIPKVSGTYSKSNLAQLWTAAGGDPKVANTAAAIALAESAGNPNARNSIGATGLWQIYNGKNTSLGLKDPLANAKAAVAKYNAAHGFTPWTTYTGADTGPGGTPGAKTYMQYLDDANAPKAKKGPAPKTQSEILQAHLDQAQGVFDTVTARGDAGVYSTAHADHQLLKYTQSALKGAYGKLSLSGRLSVLQTRRQAQANIKQRGKDRRQAIIDAQQRQSDRILADQQKAADDAALGEQMKESFAGTGFSDAALTMAQVDTPGSTADDLAVYQGRLGLAQGYYAQAKQSGDQAGIQTWGQSILTLNASIKDLTAATEQNTQQLLDDQKVLTEQAQRRANASETSLGVLKQAIADVASGAIGGKVGLGFQTPSFAGGGSRY